jgi:putative ATPase
VEDLFSPPSRGGTSNVAPLAERMRPRSLAEYAGQGHVVGEGAALRRMIEADDTPSLILWGPPGSGKTSLARVISHATRSVFEPFSAVSEGVPRLRELAQAAEERRRRDGRATVLFVDELHRLSKAQQDFLLGHVESGLFRLIGATTENPSFSVNNALLSRCEVVALRPLEEADILALLERATSDEKRGLGGRGIVLETEAAQAIAELAGGDARRAFGVLENAARIARGGLISTADVAAVTGGKQARFSRTDDRFAIISAFQKSIRNSEPQAALYWLARMIEGGEDPVYIMRRLLVMANEDVSLADPQAAVVAAAAFTTFQQLGAPEGHLAMAQATLYLATAPKSNRSYAAWKAALEAARRTPDLPVPLHYQNAPTEFMERHGFGEGYRLPFDHPDHVAAQSGMPPRLARTVFYEPSQFGAEKRIGERMAWWQERRKEQAGEG